MRNMATKLTFTQRLLRPLRKAIARRRMASILGWRTGWDMYR